MEKATRERLTGAVILVAALAILVPEMLSGPSGDAQGDEAADAMADTGPPLTTYELSLGTGAAAVRAPEPAAGAGAAEEVPARPSVPEPASEPPAEGAATAPATAAATPARPAAAPVPPPTPPAPPPRPAPAATPPPAPAPATAAGGWWVQLGSFSSEQNARDLAAGVRSRGFTVQVSKVRSGGRDLFRVRVGPEKDRAAATALRSRLGAAGEQATLVGP